MAWTYRTGNGNPIADLVCNGELEAHQSAWCWINSLRAQKLDRIVNNRRQSLAMAFPEKIKWIAFTLRVLRHSSVSEVIYGSARMPSVPQIVTF